MSRIYSSAVYRKVARLHCEHINQGFLATLGAPFLALLYEAIDRGEDSVLIVKEVDGKVIGFVSGAATLRPIYKRLLFRPFSLLKTLISCFLSISKLLKVIEILRLSKNNPVLKGLPRHELLAIVVDPQYEGLG